jgi:hypothetical protein
MLRGVNADPDLMVDAVLTAVYLHNVLSTADQALTPYESFFGHKPDVSHLRSGVA